jgi:hypothetical protein
VSGERGQITIKAFDGVLEFRRPISLRTKIKRALEMAQFTPDNIHATKIQRAGKWLHPT